MELVWNVNKHCRKQDVMEQTFETFQIIIKDGNSVNLDIMNLKSMIIVLKRWNEWRLLGYKHYVVIQKYKNAHTSHCAKLWKTTLPKFTLKWKSHSEIATKISK